MSRVEQSSAVGWTDCRLSDFGRFYGTATSLIWKPYGGAFTCVLQGLGAAGAVLIPAQRRHSTISSMIVGALLGIIMMVVTVLNSPEHRVDGWLLLFGILNWGILGSLLGLALGVSLSLIRAKFGRRSLSVRVSAAGL